MLQSLARPSRWLRPGWRSAIICASGPSFTSEQADDVRRAQGTGWRVFVVNDNWRRVPSADVLYAHDARWWGCYAAEVKSAGFLGELWTQAKPAAERHGLRWVDHRGRPGLTKTEGTIHGGGNGGYGAINLAYLFGAERIVLVGFDMKAAPSGEQHWFGEHPTTPDLRRVLPFENWIGRFDDLARDLKRAGVRCVNASPDSALRAFPRVALADALAEGA